MLPTPETCNGIDDDCDGSADDGIPARSCTSDCGMGTESCAGGAYSACSGPGFMACTDFPTCTTVPACSCASTPVEACNGVDDDCDSTVDEGCACVSGTTRPCYTGPAGTMGVGACRAGTETCTSGSWSSCSGEVVPSPELCNGVDDDCDGYLNERSLRIELSATTQATCTGGWEIVTWDDTGTELPRSAPGGVLMTAVPGRYACSGTVAFSAFCPGSGRWRDWTTWTGGTARSAGVQSVLLEGDELVNTALVCNYFPSCTYGAPSYWTNPRIPFDIALAGTCDASPLTCPDWCDGDDMLDPLCH